MSLRLTVKFITEGDVMKYDNFKKIVPENVQDKIHSLAESIEFDDLISGWKESESEQEIYPIEGNYREGWIPNQDGGFSVDQFYRNDNDSTFHFTQKQSESMSEYYNDMLESFCRDNGIESIDCIDFDNDDAGLIDKLVEYENNWFEPALLQFQVFIERFDRFDDHSPMQIVCRLSINYKDAPYYREKYAEDIKQKIYTIDEFMQLENSAIIESFKI